MPHKGALKYHIVWCTKYRRNVLTPNVQERFKELIAEKCERNKYELFEIEVMPDHVRIFCGADAKTSIHRIVSQLKGYTSHVLKKEFNFLTTRLPALWTRNYYAGTIGVVSEETVRMYIQNQKTRS